MGCFLACFGFTKKRKRRKPSNQNLSREKCHGRYVPLDSDITVKIDKKREPITPDSELKESSKEASKLKIKKKVSFNLNVKAYEPIQNYDEYLSDGEEETKWEQNGDERAKLSLPGLHCEENSIASSIRSYPQNYRYQNCIVDDEEDEIKLEELDFYYDDVYDSHGESEDDYSNDESDDESTDQECPRKMNSADTKSRNNSLVQFQDVCNEEMQRLESEDNARARNNYGQNLLNPIENLTQWKAVKAKSRSQFKRQKENFMLEKEPEIPSNIAPALKPKVNLSSVSKPEAQEIAVDASLSNWLASSYTKTISNNISAIT